MNIAVIGGGRVGLPVAAAFAMRGAQVICCEQDAVRRTTIVAGRAPFPDAGLDRAVADCIASGALKVCANIAEAVANAHAAFIAVPVNDDILGTSLLRHVALSVSEHAPSNCVLVIKSTVPPGTCASIDGTLRCGIPIVANPEFMRQGFGLEDFLSPWRIAVGVDDEYASGIMRAVYKPWIERGVTYIECGRAAAEIAKLASNAMLSSRVALINETSDLCETIGGNIDEVAKILSADTRIGKHFLHPGAGFGGACLPKDGRLLTDASRRLKVDMPAMESVFASNNLRLTRIAKRIAGFLAAHATIAVWGFGFKPDADDVRGSPTLQIIKLMQRSDVNIHGFDPAITSAAKKEAPEIRWFERPLESLVDANMLAILMKSGAFAQLSPSLIAAAMKGGVIFDCTGTLKRIDFNRFQGTLHTIGGR